MKIFEKRYCENIMEGDASMNCKDCPYNLFDEELGNKCCQFGSVEERGFHAPCEPTDCE